MLRFPFNKPQLLRCDSGLLTCEKNGEQDDNSRVAAHEYVQVGLVVGSGLREAADTDGGRCEEPTHNGHNAQHLRPETIKSAIAFFFTPKNLSPVKRQSLRYICRNELVRSC